MLNDGHSSNGTTTSIPSSRSRRTSRGRAGVCRRREHVSRRAGSRRTSANAGSSRATAIRNTVNNFTGVDWSWSGARKAAPRARSIWCRCGPADRSDEPARQRVRARPRAARHGRSGAASTSFPRSATATPSRGLRLRLDSAGAAPIPRPLRPLVRSARASTERRKGALELRGRSRVADGESGGIVGGAPRRDLDHRAHLLHFEVGYQFDARVGRRT